MITGVTGTPKFPPLKGGPILVRFPVDGGTAVPPAGGTGPTVSTNQPGAPNTTFNLPNLSGNNGLLLIGIGIAIWWFVFRK